jgi:mRNA interferase RelE/StbE
MSWSVRYHPDVADDLESLGPSVSSRVMNVIDTRICHGAPDQAGKPLSGDLTGCRRIRAGDVRIICRVELPKREIMVLAIGPRRHEEAYEHARRRRPRR